MYRHRILMGAVVSALSICLIACETSSVGSDMVSFQGSECKKEQESLPVINGLYTMTHGEDYSGLRCIAWEVEGAQGIKIDLLNIREGCGTIWEGNASLEDVAHMELRLDNPSCAVAGCGWCTYDWSFEVEGIAPGRDLSVHGIIDDCPDHDGDVRTFEAVLPLADQPQGILCDYGFFYAMEDYAWATNTVGTLHMPCSDDEDSERDLSPCVEGLVCTQMGSESHNKLCLMPCATDGDCPLPELVSCSQALCRLTSPWQGI